MGAVKEYLDGIEPIEDNIGRLYQLFESIADEHYPIIWYTLNTPKLLRTRINIKDESFTNICEISYPPADKVGYGRVNVKGKPLFYSCSFAGHEGDDNIPPRIMTLEESSAFLRDKKASGIERSTCSVWYPVGEINLICLPFLTKFDRECSQVSEIRNGWYDAMRGGRVPKSARELVEYMSVEISKDFTTPQEYMKIAHFVNYLLYFNSKTQKADGIIYPSVPAQGSGFNVTLKTEVVDSRVKCTNVAECALIKKGEKSTLIILRESKEILDDGKIVYGEFRDEEFRILQGALLEGLTLIN